jgi:hypothetical protein
MQAQACDSCHRRKSRCDKGIPCGYCQKAQVQCVYTDRSKEPVFRRQHIEALERRLRRAEAKNQALAGELAKAKVPSQSTAHHGNETGLTPGSMSASEPGGNQQVWLRLRHHPPLNNCLSSPQPLMIHLYLETL